MMVGQRKYYMVNNMILFIRNKSNETIVDVELYKTSQGAKNDKVAYIELSSTVCITPYSEFLVRFYTDLIKSEGTVEEMSERLLEVINDFNDIYELRGWLWEVYFMDKENTPEEFSNVLNEVRTMMRDMANKYNLIYVED